MANRSLVDLATPIPERAVMHDHWIALVASALGNIAVLREPTMLYRQHPGNVVGARKWGAGYLLGRLGEGLGKLRRGIADYADQAGELLDRHGDILDDKSRKILEAFASIMEQGFFRRRGRLLKYRLFKSNFARNLGTLLCI